MPQIALNGSTGHSQTTDSSGSLRNSASLGPESDAAGVRFGKTNNSISQSSAQRDSYRYQLMSTMSAVAEKRGPQHVEVKRWSDLLQAAKENVQALKNVEQLAKLRADAGVSSTLMSLDPHPYRRDAGDGRAVQCVPEQRPRALAVLTGIQAERYSPVPGGVWPWSRFSQSD